MEDKSGGRKRVDIGVAMPVEEERSSLSMSLR